MLNPLFLSILLFAFPAIAATSPDKALLFTLTRSINRNIVMYEARLKDGKFDTEEPLTVYWKMVEKGNNEEPLTKYERSHVYGVDIQSSKLDEVVFSIKAMPQRTLMAKLSNAKTATRPYAEITLNGITCELERVHVNLKDRGALSLPGITNIELHGISLQDKTPVLEIQAGRDRIVSAGKLNSQRVRKSGQGRSSLIKRNNSQLVRSPAGQLSDRQ